MSKFRKVGILKDGEALPFGNNSWLYFDGRSVSFNSDGTDTWECSSDFERLIERGTFAYDDEITDTERLEWMIENQVIITRVIFREGVTLYLVEGSCFDHVEGEFFSVREAIDDAMRRRE